MIGRTNGGGGAAQYKVYNGTSAPANPKHGDIWVKTSVEIKSVTVTSEQISAFPSSGGEGIVWVVTGTSWKDDLYANSDHRPEHYLLLYPSRCILYTNGAWAYVDAYIYNYKSQWAQFSYTWNGELFENGNQYTSVTGGWVGNNQTEIGSTLKLKVSNSRPIVSTVNAIDLSGYSTLHCIADLQLGKVGVASTKDLTVGEPAWTASTNIKAQEVTVDISSLTTGYIQLFAAASWTATVNATKVWLT